MSTKMTSGVLCRDATPAQFVVFFTHTTNTKHELKLYGDGCWRDFSDGSNIVFVQSLKEWDEEYQLYDEHGKKIPPPKPGECYEVEIELQKVV